MANKQSPVQNGNQVTGKKTPRSHPRQKQPVPPKNKTPDLPPGILEETRNVNNVSTHR
jgi:hypothetical protein